MSWSRVAWKYSPPHASHHTAPQTGRPSPLTQACILLSCKEAKPVLASGIWGTCRHSPCLRVRTDYRRGFCWLFIGVQDISKVCTEPDEKEPRAGRDTWEALHTPEPGKLREDPQGRHLMTYAEPGKAMSLCSQMDDMSCEDRGREHF